MNAPTPAKKAAAAPAETPGLITTKQMRELHALLRDHGITGDATVHDYLAAWLTEHDEEPVESRKDLPTTVAAKMIRDLARADVTTAPGGLVRAMLAVQADLPMVQKTKTARVPTKTGGEYTYTYADLADVTAAAIPLLNRHGLVFMATPRRTEGGTYELAGVLAHVSGEQQVGALPLHGNDPQSIGGAMTYHRRYLLGAMLGIVTDDDVDARQAQHAARTQEWDGPDNRELLLDISSLAGRAGVTYDDAVAKIRGVLRLPDDDDLSGVDPWVLAPQVENLRRYADTVQQQAAAAAKAAEDAASTPPYAGPSTDELLAQLEDYRARYAPETSWEEFSAKFREAHGGIGVDQLGEADPVRVGQWEAEVASWIAKNATPA